MAQLQAQLDRQQPIVTWLSRLSPPTMHTSNIGKGAVSCATIFFHCQNVQPTAPQSTIFAKPPHGLK